MNGTCVGATTTRGPDLSWVTRRAIPSVVSVTLLILLAVAPSARGADNAWTATITVSGKLDPAQADVSRVLSFGVDPVTTSDFDDGFDVASPPAAPSPNPTIYLLNTAHTNTRLQQLTSDFRAFEPTGAEEQVWSLYVSNLAPAAWTITWDISAVTAFWQTSRIVSASAGVDLDMTATTSTTIAAGDAHTYTITIREDGVPASADLAVTAVEDTPVAVTLTSEDPAIDTYTVLTQPTNGALTGTAPDLTYTPTADYAGADSFTYQADDGILQDSATVTITVTEVNDAPTADAITDPAAVAEDSGASAAITIAGLGNGGGVDETAGAAVQTLTLSAASGNTALIANADLTLTATTWTAGDADPTITFAPTADISGTALITVTATDDGTTNAVADPLSVTTTFTVTVTDVNDAPIISPIADPAAVAEDSGASAAITIAGLGMGGAADETAAQTVVITATSTDQTVVADANLTLSTGAWVDGDADPTITFTPVADANGTAIVTVTVTDDGTTNGAADALAATTTFTVTVTEVNDAPSVGAIADPAAVLEDSGASAPVAISGLGAGGGTDETAAQTITLTASSSDQTVIPDANLTLSAGTWADGDADPTITFTPAANVTGTAVVTITATDDGTTNAVSDALAATTTFTVTVSGVNDPPTFDAVADVTVAEDATAQTVSITTVSPGASADESGQTVTFTATSSDQTVVADGDIALSGSGAARTLTYTPTANANGAATITLTANDAQATNNTTTDTFVVTVTEVNDTPTIGTVADQTIAEATTGSVTVTGIDAGGGTDEATQTITLTATSSATGVVPNPTFDNAAFTEGGADPVISFTPVGTGTVTITVTATDNGTTAAVADALAVSTTFQLTVVPVFDATLTVSTGGEGHAVTFGFSSSATDSVDLGFADQLTDSSGPILSVGFAREGSSLKQDILGTPSGGALTWTLTAENLSGSAATVGFAWTQADVDSLLAVAGSYNNAFLVDASSGETHGVSASQNGFTTSVPASSTATFTLTLELSAIRTNTPVTVSLTADEWHTISVPGAGDLSALDAQNLSAFTWDAVNEVYVSLATMSSLAPVSQGAFFAAGSTTAVPLQLDVDAAAYRSVTTTLSPGWNLVGAPATQNDSTPWGGATAAILTGGAANRVFAFSSAAGYSVATTLQEGAGYWVLNPDATDSVVAMTQARHLSGTTTQFFPAPALSEMAWELPVVMRSREGAAREVTLASARDASGDFDDFDLPQPPPALGSDGGELYIRAPRPIRRMTRSVLPIGQGEGDWTIVANAPAGGATIEWDADLIPDHYRAILAVDGEPRDMRATRALRLNSGAHELRVVMSWTAPQATRALPNFPNPFNPETWIPFELDRAARVTVSVHDIRGALVRRLDLGYREAGYYTDRAAAAYWDGRNALGEPAASGVYVYILEAGEHRAARRMVIHK